MRFAGATGYCLNQLSNWNWDRPAWQFQAVILGSGLTAPERHCKEECAEREAREKNDHRSVTGGG